MDISTILEIALAIGSIIGGQTLEERPLELNLRGMLQELLLNTPS